MKILKLAFTALASLLVLQGQLITNPTVSPVGGGVDALPSPNSAKVNYFISPAGSDSNPCSSISKCLTFAHALSLIPYVMDRIYQINIADGTYAEGISIAGYSGNQITILGNPTTYSNVVFTGTVSVPIFRGLSSNVLADIYVRGAVKVVIDGLQTTGSTSGGYGLLAHNGAIVNLQQYDSAGSAATGIAFQDDAFVTFINDVFVENATTTGIEFDYNSHGILTSSQSGIVALTQKGVVVTGLTTATPYNSFTALKIGYNSHVMESNQSTGQVQLLLKNCFNGISVGLSSSFQMAGTSSITDILYILNSTVAAPPSDGSSALLGTGNSNIYSNAPTEQLQGFQYGIRLNSISYGEYTGASLTRTFIATNINATQNSVTAGY